MRIGVISDTHGTLPAEALERLRGVDHILHAGDVGEGVLEELAELGIPMSVVRGNTDPESAGLPLEIRRKLEGVSILMRHIQPPPERLAPHQVEQFAHDGVRVVVFGHTHRPLAEERGGVLFINPGSAGQPRHGLPPSVGILTVQDGRAEFELLPYGANE